MKKRQKSNDRFAILFNRVVKAKNSLDKEIAALEKFSPRKSVKSQGSKTSSRKGDKSGKSGIPVEEAILKVLTPKRPKDVYQIAESIQDKNLYKGKCKDVPQMVRSYMTKLKKEGKVENAGKGSFKAVDGATPSTKKRGRPAKVKEENHPNEQVA